MEELKLNITTENNEITVRQGDAAEIVPERLSNKLHGQLSTPFNYLKNAPAWFSKKFEDSDTDSPLNFSHLEVNREKLTLKLIVDQGLPWESSYAGELCFSKVFKAFGINGDKSFTTLELSQLIKMNRSFLETKDIAMKLVSELRNFKAKVDKALENSDDFRGNKKVLYQQTVDSNIPEAFNVNLPVFKGYDKQVMSVEINIDASDFSCRLISPEASDFINEISSDLIDAQLSLISEIYPNLKVFEL